LNLHEIGLKHGTDKATYHQYLNFYEKFINPVKVSRFLEIGILNGSSMRMWREFFPDSTIVEGWDINESEGITNCNLKQVDQTDRTQLISNLSGVYDVILDDGGHTTEMMEKSFSVLFRHTKLYIIEDLHAPWVSEEFISENDIPTIDLLDKLEIHGWLSRHSTEDERRYINQYAVVADLFYRGDRSEPLSMTIVITNKYYQYRGLRFLAHLDKLLKTLRIIQQRLRS
jgi:hypothetical protein